MAIALFSIAASAQAETRCLMLYGDINISPPLAVSPTFVYPEDIDPANFMQSATERDGPTGRSNACGAETLMTVQSGGPYAYVDTNPYHSGDGGGYAYGVTYHDRITTTPWLDRGLCKVNTSVDAFHGVDENGFGDDASGAGTVCVTRLGGPDMVIEALTLRVGKSAPLRVSVMTQGIPIAWKNAHVELTPAAVNGRLSCPARTDAQGYLSCFYEAPAKKATVETVTGNCGGCNAPAHGTIIVTKPPTVLGFFNGV
ncbi:MAG TPA: hypothetical protein VGI11_03695, partial [Variovorax sp.]